MINGVIKQYLRDKKENLKYLKYKNTLPANPMHDDIYIVEFPKSGITWLQHILGNIELQLSGRKNEYITFYNFHKYQPDIHQVKKSHINRFLNRTFIKSHAEYNSYYYFVIYLVRNPFDVMVSYYNFLLGLGERIPSFEEFIKSDNGIIAWKKHINSWNYKRIDAQRIHFLRYEDLIKDTKESVMNIYKNFGVNLEENVIDLAIDNSNIKNMSMLEMHYKKYNVNYTMSFVGKDKKISKDELLSDDMKSYIFDVAYEEIKLFYPELVNKNKPMNLFLS